MQYVRSMSGAVSKTWNSINPATLSGAIDVIVVEREDGTLACSPFHVRFGKFSLLRPYEKKVEFKVNNVVQPYSMKLGEGGEAFFVFETSANVPEALQTSPLVSPTTSPAANPESPSSAPALAAEPEPFDLDAPAPASGEGAARPVLQPVTIPTRSHTVDDVVHLSRSAPDDTLRSPAGDITPTVAMLSATTPTAPQLRDLPRPQTEPPIDMSANKLTAIRSNSPAPVSREEARTRALTLSKKLRDSQIPSEVTEEGDLMLDITGYKSSEEDALRAEVVARQILAEELEGNYDIGSLIGADDKGHLWIYSSEEAKEAAMRKTDFSVMAPGASMSSDALSDPGYQSDDDQSQKSIGLGAHERRGSDSAIGTATPPFSPQTNAADSSSRTYAKTLRLTSDQLKELKLRQGPNPVSFTVNRATCTAYMYLWKQNVPVVVSDVDGTITKSDALGHIMNMVGRDWTHVGVAKLYSDIVSNGYNVMYLTSRSVGLADGTRTYLNGISQDGYRLPRGPVILSPDRTLAALRREVYLRKPEIFKMACLRDIMGLFPQRQTPFYAGFGNRLTDALSYRSVNIPSTRIFTINSNGEVLLDLLSLNRYKTAYTTMRETVDHFFPPVGMLVHEGGENYTDFNYWRDHPVDLDDISLTESEVDEDERRESFDGTDAGDDDVLSDEMADSYLSRDSLDDRLARVVRQSIEHDDGQEIRRIISGDDLVDYDEEDVEEDEEEPDALDLIAQAAGRANSSRRVKMPLRTLSADENAIRERLRNSKR